MLLIAAVALLLPPKLNPEAAWSYAERSDSEALLVMKEGRIIFERYANGYAAKTPHFLASGTKSFNGVVAAFAQAEGLIRLDEPVAAALTEWKGDSRKARITWRQLLDMTDGLDPSFSARGGSWRGAIAAKVVADPGSAYAYSGVHHNAFAAALSRRLKGETYEAYLDRKLLSPLGIRLRWNIRDDEGNPQTAGGAAMNARDWARFGEFVRSDGEGLVPKALFRALFVGSRINPSYGLSFWIKPPRPPAGPIAQPSEAAGLEESWIPVGLRAALGAGKQGLYVVPSLGLTVVRFGPLASSRQFSHAEFLRALLGA